MMYHLFLIKCNLNVNVQPRRAAAERSCCVCVTLLGPWSSLFGSGVRGRFMIVPLVTVPIILINYQDLSISNVLVNF